MAKKDTKVKFPSGLDIKDIASLADEGKIAEQGYMKEKIQSLNDTDKNKANITASNPGGDKNLSKDNGAPVIPVVIDSTQTEDATASTQAKGEKTNEVVNIQQKPNEEVLQVEEIILPEKGQFEQFNLKNKKKEVDTKEKGLWTLLDFMDEYELAPGDKRETAHLYTTNADKIKEVALYYNRVYKPKNKITAECLLNRIVSGWIYEHSEEINKLQRSFMKM